MSARETPEYPHGNDQKNGSSMESDAQETKMDEMSASLRDLQKIIEKLKREIKSKDEQILASEEYARIVGNYVATCEFWTAPQGELIYISPSCESMTGYPPKDFFEDEKLLTNIIIDEDLDLVACKLKQMVMENDPVARLEIYFHIKHLDGKIRYIKQISQKVYGQDGVYLGRRASNIDLTSLGVPSDISR